MSRLRFLTSLAGPDVAYGQGDVVEVEDFLAARLADGERAEYVDDAPAALDEAAVAVAAVLGQPVVQPAVAEDLAAVVAALLGQPRGVSVPDHHEPPVDRQLARAGRKARTATVNPPRDAAERTGRQTDGEGAPEAAAQRRARAKTAR